MEERLPTKGCTQCLWTTPSRCLKCPNKKEVCRHETEDGRGQQVVYECDRDSVETPHCEIPIGMQWDVIEI